MSAEGLSLVEELVPAPDPLDVARRLADGPHLLLLDSGLRPHPQGRYSFVAVDPFDWVEDRPHSPCPYLMLTSSAASKAR